MNGNLARKTNGRWATNPYHTGNPHTIGGTIPVGECPICHRRYRGHPAISRKDNKTKICPECGVREALDDAANELGMELI